MHRVSVYIAETNTYIRTCAVTLRTLLLCCTYTSACTTCMLWTTVCNRPCDHCQHAPPTLSKIFTVQSTERVQHAGMPYTNLNTYCTHKSTLISHHPLSRTQLTWVNSRGRRAHREAACCPSRRTLCRAHGSGGDGCSEGEQSNTPQTLWWELGTTLSKYTTGWVDNYCQHTPHRQGGCVLPQCVYVCKLVLVFSVVVGIVVLSAG